MFDPGLFSRPSPHLGEPYIPSRSRDYKEPHVPLGLYERIEPFRRTGIATNKVALVLVLGICGVTILGFCAPFAWTIGARTLRYIDEEGTYTDAERTLAQVGWLLGIIGTLILLFKVGMYFLNW